MPFLSKRKRQLRNARKSKCLKQQVPESEKQGDGEKDNGREASNDG